MDTSDNVHGKLRMIHRKISKERRERERPKLGWNWSRANVKESWRGVQQSSDIDEEKY